MPPPTLLAYAIKCYFLAISKGFSLHQVAFPNLISAYKNKLEPYQLVSRFLAEKHAQARKKKHSGIFMKNCSIVNCGTGLTLRNSNIEAEGLRILNTKTAFITEGETKMGIEIKDLEMDTIENAFVLTEKTDLKISGGSAKNIGTFVLTYSNSPELLEKLGLNAKTPDSALRELAEIVAEEESEQSAIDRMKDSAMIKYLTFTDTLYKSETLQRLYAIVSNFLQNGS